MSKMTILKNWCQIIKIKVKDAHHEVIKFVVSPPSLLSLFLSFAVHFTLDTQNMSSAFKKLYKNNQNFSEKWKNVFLPFGGAASAKLNTIYPTISANFHNRYMNSDSK